MNWQVVLIAFAVTLGVILGSAAVAGLVVPAGMSPPPALDNPQYDPATLPDPSPGTAEIELATRGPSNTVLVHTGRDVSDRDLRPLTAALAEAGHRVVGDPPTSARLDEADALVIVGVASFTQDEVEMIGDFVDDGGRLFIATDPFAEFDAGPEGIGLESTLGVWTRPGFVYNLVDKDFDHLRIVAEPTAEHQLTDGVGAVVMPTAAPVDTRLGQPLLRPTEGARLSTTREATDAPVMVVRGDVVLTGGWAFLSPETAQRADNDALIANIGDFLVSGDRTGGA